VDISLGAINGACAVRLMTAACEELPPLRPLALAVKALLKERRLNEVWTGGLSSYSLVNMVIAHLQCEGFKLDLRSHAVSRDKLPVLAEQQQYLLSLAAGQGACDYDLGLLLTGFLRRWAPAACCLLRTCAVWAVHVGCTAPVLP
jgi:DNA polymerase sigma